MAGSWYCVLNGQRVGPVAVEELKNWMAAGRLSPNDMVWHESMPNWVPARQVSELAAPVSQAPMGYAPQQPQAAYPQQILSYASPGMGAPVTPRAIEMLRQTKPWVRFIGVLTAIFAGLAVIGGVIAMVVLASMPRSGPEALLGLVYVAMGALYLAPAVFLNRYASRIADLMMTQRSDSLEAALEAQKSFWRFVGILTLVLMVVYALVLVVFVVGAGAMSSRSSRW